MSGRLRAASLVRHASTVTEQDRLQQMIDELRRMRERCEPKSNQNPRYHRYSSAVSSLLWIIDDLATEQTPEL
jgi:hypothetical protein